MTVTQISLLVAVSLSIGVGQILFKLAAERINWSTNLPALAATALNPYLFAAGVVYVIATGLWLYLLKGIPLSRAYPFVVISFVFVPLASALFLGERVGLSYVLGLGLIVAGLYFVVR